LLVFFMSGTAIADDSTFKYSTTFSRIDKANPILLDINATYFQLTRVEVYSLNIYRNVVMNLTEEQDISGTTDANFAFFNLGVGIPESAVNKTVIKFKVRNDYMLENYIKKSTVYLARYSQSWKEWPTVIEKEDAGYVYYRATGDEIGLFAIAGRHFDIVKLGEYKQAVQAGKSLVVPVIITNLGNEDRDFIISIEKAQNLLSWRVEEGGLNKEYKIKVKKKSTQTAYASIITSEESKEGSQYFEVIVKGDEKKILEGTFLLQNPPKADKVSFSVEKMFDKISGDENKIKVLLHNEQDISKRYFITVSGADGWATYDVTPSTVMFLEPGQESVAYVNLVPIAGNKDSEKQFSVEIKDSEKVVYSENFSVDVDFADKVNRMENLGNQVLVLSTMLLILAVIIYPLIRRARKVRDEQ
jgi:PGF-pre-PGF domain-containing protein